MKSDMDGELKSTCLGCLIGLALFILVQVVVVVAVELFLV